MGTVVEYPTPRSRGGGSCDIPVAVQKSLIAQTLRKRLLRPFFEAFRAAMMALYPPVANIGSVVYIDMTAGSDGAGTFASPRNIIPTIASSTTYLFKEGTRAHSASYALTAITATNVLFGTYSAFDGSRVFQHDRLATIDGTPANWYIALRWSGTTGNFTLSGIRIIGGNNTSGAGVNLFQANSGATAASTLTIEHCVFENIGDYLLSGGVLSNIAIAVNGPKLICRFNRICVEGDGISYNPSTGSGFEFICNEIITPPSIVTGGPDCIQVQRTGTTQMGHMVAIGNWLNQAANTKQAFLIVGGTAPATGESTFFARNFLFGVDCVADPPRAPFGGQLGYVNDSICPAIVAGNYFDQFLGWASVPSNSLLANNIGILDHLSTSFLPGFATANGATGSVVANNTAISLTRTWTPNTSQNVGFWSNAANTFVNNVSVNLGMLLAGGATESKSVFVGSAGPCNGSGVAIALGSGSVNATLDAVALDAVGRPGALSSLLADGLAVNFRSMAVRYPDVFGQTAWNQLPNLGAAQGWMNT